MVRVWLGKTLDTGKAREYLCKVQRSGLSYLYFSVLQSSLDKTTYLCLASTHDIIVPWEICAKGALPTPSCACRPCPVANRAVHFPNGLKLLACLKFMFYFLSRRAPLHSATHGFVLSIVPRSVRFAEGMREGALSPSTFIVCGGELQHVQEPELKQSRLGIG